MEPPIVLLALGIIILALGIAILVAFDISSEDRIANLENIHRRGNWHDD